MPAENFGRAFAVWRDGDGRCTNDKGHFYKGRRCAEKVSAEYRLMQADMYNLFPAVGAVNAIRSNYNYELLPDAANTFGTCEMKIENRRAEPPERARGEIARAMLYMEGAYAPVYRMSDRSAARRRAGTSAIRSCSGSARERRALKSSRATPIPSSRTPASGRGSTIVRDAAPKVPSA